MTYLLGKHKKLVFLTLLLILTIGIWYNLTNKNINIRPEKAKLVLNNFNNIREI